MERLSVSLNADILPACTATLRRARDPEVKRPCGGNVRHKMACLEAACDGCSRGAWTGTTPRRYLWQQPRTGWSGKVACRKRGGRTERWLVCIAGGAVGPTPKALGTALTAVRRSAGPTRPAASA